jgi:hypothetical protein
MTFAIEKPCVLVATLLSWELVSILYILLPFTFLMHFLHTHLIYLCFTCYTSLYLLDYACHCAKVTRNEM